MTTNLKRRGALGGLQSRLGVMTRLALILVVGWVMSLAGTALGADGIWIGDAASLLWSGTGNWLGGTIADGPGATAWITNNIAANRASPVINGAVSSRTLGLLYIGDSVSTYYTFTLSATGGGTLTFDNSGANAQLIQIGTSKGDTISAPLVLAGSLDVTNAAAANTLTISGGITGSGNLSLNSGTGGPITLKTLAVNNAGTITNSGAGSALVTISGGVGSNVTAVTQNSADSALTISTTALTVNSDATTLANTSGGTAVLTVSGGVTGTGNLTLKNDSAIVDGIALVTTAVNHAGAITNSGSGADVTISAAIGANVKTITEASASSALTIGGALTVNSGGTTLANDSNAKPLTVSRNMSGTGNMVLKNNGSLDNGITLAVGTTNTCVGQVINSGSGSGSVLISGVIGTGVSGVFQSSGSSPLVLSGANTYSTGTTISTGTLRIANTTGSATGTGAVNINDGGALGGSGSISGPVTNELGGTLAPGIDGAARGKLTMTSNLTWNGGGVFHCEVASLDGAGGVGSDYDAIVVSTALNAVPGGSNLVIRMDSMGQALAFDADANYALKLIAYGSAPGLDMTQISLDTNAFLVGGTWSLTNLNNAIYVVYLGETSANKNYWRGTGNWSTAGNWSKGHVPWPGEDVEFDFLNVANCTGDVITNDLGSLTLSAGYTGTVEFRTKYTGNFTNVTIAGNCTVNSGVLTHQANTGTTVATDCLRMTIASNLTVGADGQVNVDAKGYAAGRGPGAALSGGQQRSRGASHGGLGGHGYYLVSPVASSVPLPTYGSFLEPVTLGSGGYAQGGGSVRLNVAGTTRVNGSITANAAQALGRAAGNAGGSIYLTTVSFEGGGPSPRRGAAARTVRMHAAPAAGGACRSS